jgi:hypothetical protein
MTIEPGALTLIPQRQHGGRWVSTLLVLLSNSQKQAGNRPEDELDSWPVMPENQSPKARKKRGFLARHSLSIVSVAILILWTVLYARFDPTTHWGAFFGNAIADWSGVVVTILATKYLYERGSTESRKPPKSLEGSITEKIRDHSLTLFLLVTGLCWVFVYRHSDPQSKWGQVVGNVVSEWTQILALVIMTKRLFETHSKESHR